MPKPELLPKCVGCGQTYAFNLGGGDFEDDILESQVCAGVVVHFTAAMGLRVSACSGLIVFVNAGVHGSICIYK